MLQKKPVELSLSTKKRLASSFATKNNANDEELNLTFSRRFCLLEFNVEKAGKSSNCDSFASPLQKHAHSLGAMLPPFLLMEIHFNYNFTKKKAKHKVVLVNFYFQHKVIYCSHVWNHTYGSSKLIITSHFIELRLVAWITTKQ